MTLTPTLPIHARTWQYIADRALSDEECVFVEREAKAFCSTWTAHHQQLASDACVLFNQILVLIVDEAHAGASGCSIDKSTHFVEALGSQLGVDFFGRDYVFAQEPSGGFRCLRLGQLQEAVQSGAITLDTPVFDTLANTLGAIQAPPKRLADTWLKRFL